MYPARALMANPANKQPSISLWGSLRMISLYGEKETSEKDTDIESA